MIWLFVGSIDNVSVVINAYKLMHLLRFIYECDIRFPRINEAHVVYPLGICYQSHPCPNHFAIRSTPS